MEAVGIVLALAGVFVLLASWFTARAGALTLGQGAAWFLLGLALLLLGLMQGSLTSWLRSMGVGSPEVAVLGLGGILLLAVLLQQASILAHTTARVRLLAQEVALLRHMLEEVGWDRGKARSHAGPSDAREAKGAESHQGDR